ncbi:MAG TPA: apolipoprotein N-acyltransferase [Acidobacteriaceae bacterium]|nr:apolipoprotein N-acyltransferase [Acidobacteriaceae bacterium]
MDADDITRSAFELENFRVLDSDSMRKVPLQLYLFALLSGVLQALPFPIADAVPLWRRGFCWICLVPLLFAFLGNQNSGKILRPSQAALLGYLCGIVWYLLNCYWIYPTMHLYGDLSQAASVGVLILFALYLGLYLALFGAIFGIIRARGGSAIAVISSPILWVAVEFARDRITGFPWDLLGYTQVDNLFLTRMAPWTGVFGLSLAVAFVNMFWALPGARVSRTVAASSLCVAALLTLGGCWTDMRGPRLQPDEAKQSAVLLQENLSVGVGMQKGTESKDDMLASFAALSQPSMNGGVKPQLIAWPESPASFLDSDPAYRDFMERLARSTGVPIIADDLSLGPRILDGSYSLYNSASFFRPDGTYGGRYDKIHLVPFGEYVPYKPLFFFTGHLLDGLPFIPGTQRTLFHEDGHAYGVFICYESIFGDEIRHFVHGGANVLVNLSDDGWYGNSSAPWEHLDMVRMRAIENDRWVLRATNTGVTAAIDPHGRVEQAMPRHIRGSVVVNFDYRSDETFYTRHGDWIAWICAVLTTVLVALGFVKSQRPAAAQ